MPPIEDLTQSVIDTFLPLLSPMQGLMGYLGQGRPTPQGPLPKVDPATGDIVYPDGRREKVGAQKPQKQSMSELLKDAIASRQLEQEGSVMAGYGDPGFGLPSLDRLRAGLAKAGARASAMNQQLAALEKGGDTGDLLSTILDIMPVGGMLGPIARSSEEIDKAFGKGISTLFGRAQKKIAKAMYRGDPRMLVKAAADPERMLNIQPILWESLRAATNKGGRTEQELLLRDIMDNAFAHHQATMGGGAATVRVDPNVMRGQLPAGIQRKQAALKRHMASSKLASGNPARLGVDIGLEGLPSIATHELRHFISDPMKRRLSASAFQGEPAAQRAVNALLPFIGHAKYGTSVVEKMAGQEMRPIDALNEALSYLSQPEGRSPVATLLHDVITHGQSAKKLPADLPLSTIRQMTDALEAMRNVRTLTGGR